MLTKIDELNRPEYEAIDYEEYFAPMDIPEEDKEKRVEMAEEIDDIYYNFFAMIATMVATQQYLDWDYLNDYLNTRLYDTFENYEYSATRDYLQRYADLTASNTVTTTLDHQGEEYCLSDERASRLAAENAQTIANYTELQDAILAGYNVKIWKTKRDKKVRDSHRELEGKKIGINQSFRVGSSLLLCPCDGEHSNSLRDIAGCRCSLHYEYDPKFDEVKEEEKEEVLLSRGNKKLLDMTDLYRKKATPGKGEKLKDPEFKDQNGEEDAGEWVHKTIGGNIKLLPENNPDGEPNPDLLWNGKLWDLKTPEGTNNLSKLLRKGIHQIDANPGGVLVDISKINITMSDLEKIIFERAGMSASFDLDFVIKNKDKFVKALRYKKGE